MANYSDVVVSIQSGTKNANGLFYTCPTGKYAKVSLKIAGNNPAGVCLVRVGSSSSDPVVAYSTGFSNQPFFANEITLASGEVLYHEGLGIVAYTALEYSNP